MKRRMRRDRKRAVRRMMLLVLSIMLGLGMGGTAVFAESGVTGSAVLPVSGPGVQVTMEGNVTPTILSVTMPSNIIFDIGKSNEGENKVISPEVRIENSSDLQVQIYAMETQVDLRNLPGTVYVPSTSGGSVDVVTGGAIYVPSMGGIVTSGGFVIQSNELAIGLSDEEIESGSSVMPGLSQATWLVEDNGQHWNSSDRLITQVPANGQKILHVVGMIGEDVPENRTFTVVPTLIAALW